MRPTPLLLALVLLSAGCVRDGAPAEAAAVEEISPAAEPDPAPAPEPAPEPQPEPEPSPEPAPEPEPQAERNETPDALVPEPPAARVEVLTWSGVLTGAGASPPDGPSCCLWRTASGETTEGSFDVVGGLDGVVVELAWEDGMTDLELQLLAADYREQIPPSAEGSSVSTHEGHVWSATGGQPGAPDARATIVVADAEALALEGAWHWRVGAEGAANGVAFEVRVSLFHDAPPPGDYTAFA